MANRHVNLHVPWLSLLLLLTITVTSNNSAEAPTKAPLVSNGKGPITCVNGQPVIADLDVRAGPFNWTSPAKSDKALNCVLIIQRTRTAANTEDKSYFQQLKVTWLAFELSQPNATTGVCATDNLSITGNEPSASLPAAKVPANICGSESADSTKVGKKTYTSYLHRKFHFLFE